MFNRPFNTVLARLGLVAAVLATLLILAPAASAADTEVEYPENSTHAVATFSAMDQDGDPIVWSLGGADEDDFMIDEGVLNFKSPPNYESPKSASVGTREDMNVYNVTVQATGGSHTVQVTVTNVDEDGSISFDGLGQFQPQVGRNLEAVLSDPDGGETDELWQWSKSMDMETWMVIDGATTAKRSPAEDDEGYYLRATVTYTDLFDSGKVVSKVTGNKVEERTVSNAAPSFDDQDDRFDDPETTGTTENEGTQVNRSTAENSASGTNIGKPVSATDSDGDILVYSLSGTVSIGGADVDVTTLFSIVPASGQLKAKAKLNFEGGTTDNPTDNLYNVTVTATDPSGANEEQVVTITLTDVNEAPAFEDGDDTPTVLNVVENLTQLRTGADGTTNLEADAYNADDEDVGDPAFPAEDNATLTLAGADKKYFEITDAGALTIIDDDTATADVDESHTPNFEKKSSYSIAIVATSGEGDRTRRARLDVTVHVIDAEDEGSVTLNAREPQVGSTVVATVSDPDGGVNLTRWTWATQAATGDPLVCPAADAGAWDTVTPDVTSGAYTPKTADVASCLRATATYTDDIAGNVDTNDDAAINTETVHKVSEKPVQASEPDNSAPVFPDQDLTTQGDQSDTASRSVAENIEGEPVGGPISATDTDGDALLFTLSGDDAASFKTDNNGQITTKVKLDYETKDEYMVALKATDPSGASDTIMVTITVTDENDNAEITGSTAVDYDENGTDPVATFSAMDQDGDDIVWSLGGTDEDDFMIDGGVLSFKKAPNYESPASDSIGTRADKNVYNVTVQATGGTHAVVVTVINVDENGSVSFTDLGQVQPQVGRSLEATLSDPDEGETDEVWQWARSMDMETWTDIDGATSQKRAPVPADEGYYLRASVTYTDTFGPDKTASKVTPNKVEERTVANAAPSFDDLDETTGDQAEDPNVIIVTRDVDENTPSGTNIGKPVSASDGDNDVLVYTLSGNVDIGGTATAATSLFGISSSTGQLKTKAALDFENTAGNPTGNDYAVTVTATDPSGASAMQTVTISLEDVNEAPKFDASTDAGIQDPPTTLNVVENTSQLRTGADGTTDLDAAAYNADDEDATQTLTGSPTPAETEADAALSLHGADAKYFAITDAGALTLVADNPDTTAVDDQYEPNFESKSSYSITIQAQSGSGARTLRTRLDVTVHVIDAEDPGSVSLTAREPQAGRTVVATLSDPDGGIILTTWKWERGDELADDVTNCDSPGTWAEVSPSVSSGAYTPKEADEDRCLRATATYTDNIDGDGPADHDADTGTDGLQVVKVSEKPVQLSEPDNTAPKFQDQDLTTDGDQSDETTREVDENKADEEVGGPITAVDEDNDAMIYRLSGDDAASFKTDNNGQIKTKVKLDYETKSMYVVALTAEDPSGASDSIMVTIMVLDGPDPAVITTGPAADNPPAFDSDSLSRSVNENQPVGTAVGAPVVATDDPGDTLTYSDNSDYFDIDENGQITTTMMLDHESMDSHTVVVTATDANDNTGTVTVTVAVGDMHAGCTVMDNMGLTNDCEALLDAKEMLGGSLDWTEDNPLWDWEGVTLTADEPRRVTSVWLRGKELDGMVPASLARVEMLTVLNLHTNALTGEIPDLSGLALTQLYLSNNMLTGGVPEWLNGEMQMTDLWLWNNMLSGSVPDLSGMTSLNQLKLQNNMLDGGLPGGSMLPGNASMILLQYNDLGGDLADADLSGLSVRTLWIHGNGLTGEIDPSMLPMSATNLNLRENSLSGGVPDMTGLSNLVFLRLGDNQLEGSVPGSLGDLANLEKLQLQNNQFTGIDAGLENAADTLTQLYLSGNNFATGTCLMGDLADVETNDFDDAGLAACP